MKRIYVSKSIGNHYYFSEFAINRVDKREGFRWYEDLVSYLGSDKLKPLRKRNNLEFHINGLDESEVMSLKEDVKKIGFRANMPSSLSPPAS
jgi:hypothetical protein